MKKDKQKDKQKNKSNNKIKIISIVLIVISLLFIISGGLYIFLDQNFSFVLIGEEEVELGVNKKYLESGAVSKFFGKKIDNIKITNNIDNTKVGEYKVNYSSKVLFITKRLQRIVIVKDLEKPHIELNGEKDVYLNLGEEYQEAGYTASDNVDGDITDKVKVDSNLDINAVGTYVIKYSVVDSANNETVVERNVEVADRQTILQAPLNSFNLDNVYTDVLLKYDQSKEYDYFKDTVFLGDSNVAFLYQHGRYLSGAQTWGMYNLNIVQINTSTFTTFVDGRSMTLNEALSTYQPKYLIASVGINTILHMNKDQLVQETQALIDNVKNNYPNTKLVFSAVFPVYSGTINGNHQYRINQYNYYVLETCHKNKIGFINFADRLKDESGYANHDYYECKDEANCGFHLNEKGKAYYIDYIKHIDLGGV